MVTLPPASPSSFFPRLPVWWREAHTAKLISVLEQNRSIPCLCITQCLLPINMAACIFSSHCQSSLLCPEVNRARGRENRLTGVRPVGFESWLCWVLCDIHKPLCRESKAYCLGLWGEAHLGAFAFLTGPQSLPVEDGWVGNMISS